jgi:hypothetical protein
MGMDLHRGSDYFRWDAPAWVAILEAAMNYGWEPTGTGPPRGCLKKDWDGTCNCYGNEGQLFYARDAKNLATSLALFLTAPETIRLKKTKRHGEVLSAGRRVFKAVSDLINAISEPTKKTKATKARVSGLTSDQRKCIQQFVSFCRKGSFRIY